MKLSVRRWITLSAGLAFAFAFAVAGDASAQQVKAATGKDLVLRGDAKCTRCHDEGEDYPVLAIGQTRHGMKADSRTPTCTSCHGESDTHITKAEGAKERSLPDVMFRGKAKSDAAAINGTCLACHSGGKRMHWAGSGHESRDVACTTCHTVHVSKDLKTDKLAASETCFTCHKEQRAQSLRASAHPIRDGKMACTSCHNPHGSSGPTNLVKNTVNETCWSCHAEKRGPFLWEHPPAVDSCTNCHQPHGSNHPTLLKARAPWLCQECHLAPQHPSGFYDGNRVAQGLGGTNPAQQVLLKGCNNCHYTIHGSNHPSGARFTR